MMLIFLNPLSTMNFVASVSSEIDEYYPEEREALLKLRDSLSSNSDLHGNWTGPPCINNSSRWAGIACSNWHIVHIVLQGIQLAALETTLSGPVPNLTNLVYLEYVVLSYNRFWGSIPLEYIELPNLRVLELQSNYLDGHIPPFDQPTLRAFNVSYNHLEGPIPQTAVLQKFPKSSYDHNSNLCGSPLETSCPPAPPVVVAPSPSPLSPNIIPPKKKNNLQEWSFALIVAAAALVLFLVIFVSLSYSRKVHRKQAAKEEQQTGWAQTKMPHLESLGDPEKRVELDFFDKEMPAAFDLDDLLRASAQVLGKGKLGTTYKVTLESGPVVVVKRLKNMNELSKKEFTQQMQLLGNMRHENLVQILSFYYSKEEKLVISKFESSGTLFELLHGQFQ
ncbi:leucine-rich repeat transmembrane protein kinase family protein [Prunus dulcis]|uniref:Leucine-rich repeat transmembrane protein kinase family protein n=1 Tax=Prunus dulcis TaxID=3755 RepID=A0A4Y1QWZ6_PRUDU|nr:leucine-rich repeat transmembrane protein kinase family protein [Prunus dulcis]